MNSCKAVWDFELEKLDYDFDIFQSLSVFPFPQSHIIYNQYPWEKPLSRANAGNMQLWLLQGFPQASLPPAELRRET